MGIDVEVCMVRFLSFVFCFSLSINCIAGVNEPAFIIELPEKVCIGVQDLSSLLQPVPEIPCPQKDAIRGLINSSKVIYRSDDGNNGYIELTVQEVQIKVSGKPATLNVARELKIPKK